ncbi:hypothetical protein BQ8794_60122 [Mesorhizobium prunaredense]|uniref:Uncharacterized protein n=1 Tax=Mesorhizobium prunaredense TaxID=1631249 RepID=A0A1R3VFW6_9HYPH|nr:hypothetical protein BQ8794_60122 [Mesorhizobium prunaredense]
MASSSRFTSATALLVNNSANRLTSKLGAFLTCSIAAANVCSAFLCRLCSSSAIPLLSNSRPCPPSNLSTSESNMGGAVPKLGAIVTAVEEAAFPAVPSYLSSGTYEPATAASTHDGRLSISCCFTWWSAPALEDRNSKVATNTKVALKTRALIVVSVRVAAIRY